MKTVFILNRPGTGASARTTAPTATVGKRVFGGRRGQLGGALRGSNGQILSRKSLATGRDV